MPSIFVKGTVRTARLRQITGLLRSVKFGNKIKFLRPRESRGILYWVREIQNSSLKSGKSQGILLLGWHKVLF